MKMYGACLTPLGLVFDNRTNTSLPVMQGYCIAPRGGSSFYATFGIECISYHSIYHSKVPYFKLIARMHLQTCTALFLHISDLLLREIGLFHIGFADLMTSHRQAGCTSPALTMSPTLAPHTVCLKLWTMTWPMVCLNKVCTFVARG